MTAKAIFISACILSILFFLRFLVALLKVSGPSGSYVLKISEPQTKAAELHFTATAASGERLRAYGVSGEQYCASPVRRPRHGKVDQYVHRGSISRTVR
jgi:hypothetical protein